MLTKQSEHKIHSSGAAGEQAALLFFARHGWQMFQVPPDVRVCGQTGRPGVFLAAFKTGGMPDFLGFISGYEPGQGVNQFRAVEVKECNTDSMPASRLSMRQRDFMAALPEGTAHVLILWRCGEYEMFSFVNRGSYKKSTGIK